MQNNQRPGVSWNNLDVYEWGTQAGESGRAYVPNACVQCEKPACVDACPTGASVRRDDGITVIDYEKCIACGLCLAACPYGARKLNRTSENMFGADVPAPYESYGVQRELVAEKCIFCEARLAEGKQPACVVNCPGRARYFGDLDDPDSSAAKAVAAAGAENCHQLDDPHGLKPATVYILSAATAAWQGDPVTTDRVSAS